MIQRPNKLHLATLIVITTFLSLAATRVVAQEEVETLTAVVKGVRVNVVEGQANYKRDGDAPLEAGVDLKEGDSIKTGKNARAEILLQPGNLLRVAEESELQLLGDEYDRIRLRLVRGSISFELMKSEYDVGFSERIISGYDLIRVFTPDAEVLALQPGIIRISVDSDGHTEVAVRKGDAILNGQRVKEKRVASLRQGVVQQTERDPKVEDAFDTWCRTRADTLVQLNRSLKKEEPWVKAQKEGGEPAITIPSESKWTGSPYVVSARPGTLNFVESGLEFQRPQEEWQTVDYDSRFNNGDKVRSAANSFGELTLLPDLYLRLSGSTEVLFEELSPDALTLRVSQGSAILEVPSFDKKLLPPVKVLVGNRSVVVSDSGNYRFDVTPSGENIIVRDGKLIFGANSVGSCRKITNGNISDCGNKQNDNFDWWSMYRGEGLSFEGVVLASRSNGFYRQRQNSTGFWYQPNGVDYYTFVPFYSTYFQSPYGGNYAVVLSPRRMPGFVGPSSRFPRLGGSPIRQ